MSELAGVIGLICFMAWLWMGGWAYVSILDDLDKETKGKSAGTLFLVCLVLGPFMYGANAAWQKIEAKKLEKQP